MDDAFQGIDPIVHLRSYDWDSQSTSGERSVAWALGGWAGIKTRWYGDLLQLGVLGYTSQKLYGAANEGGSQLLQPDQDPITVLGQAYASLRYAAPARSRSDASSSMDSVSRGCRGGAR